MPYLVILAVTLAVLTVLWWPELSRRPAGSHAATGAAPAGWEPYARSFDRHQPRHALPSNTVAIANRARLSVAACALAVVVAFRCLAPATLQAA